MSFTNNNPYQGFDLPYAPSYNDPYNRCSCGAASACGNEHQPAVKVESVTRVGANGQKENVSRVVPLGHIYPSVAHRAFSVWDGALALNDLYAPKQRSYQPPAFPFVCDRPLAGASLCTARGGAAQCSP